MVITREEIEEYVKTTNLVLFIDDVKIESINDFFIHVQIPGNREYIVYEGFKINYESILYDKENRILHLNLETKIILEPNEFLILEEINSEIYMTKHKFTDELINCDSACYPIFETSIKQSYDGSVSVKIYMKYYLEQINFICVHDETYDDFNLAINQTSYIKTLLQENKNTLIRLQDSYDEQTQTSILIDGVLYKFNYILDGYVVLNELSEYYSTRNKFIKIYQLLNKSFAIISNGEYIVYDENIYKNNEICEDLKIPNKFKGSYFESIYRFYDTVTQNDKLEDESLNCIKNDIKNNYDKLCESERDSHFYDAINNGLVFIENNKAIKFNDEVVKYIDSVMKEI